MFCHVLCLSCRRTGGRQGRAGCSPLLSYILFIHQPCLALPCRIPCVPFLTVCHVCMVCCVHVNQFLERMELKYHQQALTNGCLIVGSCGFDSVPAGEFSHSCVSFPHRDVCTVTCAGRHRLAGGARAVQVAGGALQDRDIPAAHHGRGR